MSSMNVNRWALLVVSGVLLTRPPAMAITEVLTETFEDAIVLPSSSIVGTDNRFLRPLGIPAYGFIPCLLSQEERDGFHAHDEFLTVENLNLGLEVMYEVVRRLCESQPSVAR